MRAPMLHALTAKILLRCPSPHPDQTTHRKWWSLASVHFRLWESKIVDLVSM